MKQKQQSKTICARINTCISYILIILSAIWFIFVVIINNRLADPRINALNLMSPISQTFQDGLYLRKIHLNEQYLNLNTFNHYNNPNAKNDNQKQNIHARSFELIQIMNDYSPNIVGNQAIVIISITNQKIQLSAMKFAQFLYKNTPSANVYFKSMNNTANSDIDLELNEQQERNKKKSKQSEQSHSKNNNNNNNKQTNNNNLSQIPIYILRQTQPVILSNQKYLLAYRQQIHEMFNYFTHILDIKKLSVLAYDIGGLLTLYTLSIENDYSIFSSLNKVVLINPFNIDIKVFHSPPINFVENYLKNSIIQNKERFDCFNKLRLIIISTKRTIFPENQYAQQYFTFSYKKKIQVKQNQHSNNYVWDKLKPQKDKQSSYTANQMIQNGNLYRFENTHTLSTRAMWNVFCFFDRPIYFFYQPFVYLLSKFFKLDSKKEFSYNQIQYFFHYKQSFQIRQLSQKIKRKYINKCVDFNLQNYSYNGNTFNEQCIRLLRKQTIYFQHSSILLYSKEKFEVYGEDFQKIYPFQSKTTYMVYHIERLNEFRRIFVINRKSAMIHMKIAPIFTPLHNPIVSFQPSELIPKSTTSNIQKDYSQVSFQNLTNFQIIRTCEPANLIFPLHFAKMARFGHGIIFNKEYNNNCYTQYDNYDFYPDWFMLNWNILRNIMIFTMFSSHILKKSINQRFFTQNFVNFMLVYVNTGSLYLFQNFIILSTLCVFEVLIKYIVKMTDHLLLVRKVMINFLWIPLVLDISSSFYENTPSSWNFLFLLLGLTISKHNFIVILIKLFFLIDYIRYDCQNIKGILLTSLWTYNAAIQIDFGSNMLLRKKVIDILFLISIAICINEQGSVINQIINAYIAMSSLLYLNRFF